MNRNDIYQHLRKAFIFASMDESDIARIALRFKPFTVKAGEVICRQGDAVGAFYIIDSGEVRLTKVKRDKEKHLARLSDRDFFGAEALLRGKPCSLTVQAVSETVVLFRMSAKDFHWMIHTYPQMKENLDGYIKSYALGRKKNFPWLDDNEFIHVVSRKHIALLWYGLTVPMIIGFVAVVAAGLAFFAHSGAMYFGIFAATLFVISFLWAIWAVIDWGNDYYIVTNRRVVWLEKVIGLYDSRQESPLDAVLSVNVTSDQAQRMIGTGDVIVRTYTGSIVMKNVDRPNQFAIAINAYWEHSKEISALLEKEEIERIVHQRLFGETNVDEGEEGGEYGNMQSSDMLKRSLLGKIFGNFLKMRYVEGDNITYRKHWYILLQKSWKPLLVFVLLTALILFLYLPVRETKYAFTAGTTALILWGAMYVIILMWWLYHYLDWRNDVYVLTTDKLFDIERKPLGREEKKVAPLASVLSLEHTREGILGLVLNFGNVIINVGSAKLVFFGVHDPATVQHDIFNRMYAMKQEQEREQAKREREKMMDWLTIYQRELENKKKNDENHPDFY